MVDNPDLLPSFDEELEPAAPEQYSGPLEWYWHFQQRPDFEPDADQLKVLGELDRLFNELEDYRQYRAGMLNRLVTNLGGGRAPPRGMYIWGGVGRGKSLMMDAFYKVSRHRRKRRVHFHEFMREVHGRLAELSGTADPLDAVSTDIARSLRLLCFDEFHVSDIADAMILGRLLELLIAKGVVLVLTSNYPPEGLYPNGLQRARFLPAIEVLQQSLDVVSLGQGTDHRRRILESHRLWHVPPGERADAELVAIFEAVTKAAFESDGTLSVNGRALPFRRRAKGVVWFDFHPLLGEPRSQGDYLELAAGYHTVLISGVPRLDPDHTDIVRRLTWLVDVFYDKGVRLAATAEEQPEDLVTPTADRTGPGTMVRNEFARTASRLREMQSRAYFARKHASAHDPGVLRAR